MLAPTCVEYETPSWYLLSKLPSVPNPESRAPTMRTLLPLLFAFPITSIAISSITGADITVQKRSRVENAGSWTTKETTENWQPKNTAIIVCDVWDSHHCLNAVRRCVEMAPRMNEVLRKARDQG